MPAPRTRRRALRVVRFLNTIALVAIVAASALVSTSAASAAGNQSPGRAIGLPAATAVVRDPATGTVTFVGTSAGAPIGRPAGVSRSARPEEVARAFLADHGAAFGVRDQARELRATRVEPGPQRGSTAHFQQEHRGVPVLGGELNVSMDRAGRILSANGEISPQITVSTAPSVSRTSARDAALSAAAQAHGVPAAGLTATDPALWILDGRLLGGPVAKSPRLVWRMDVTSATRPDIVELVLIDAATGAVAVHFNQVAHAKTRQICDANNLNAKVPCTAPFRRSEGQGPVTGAGSADVNNAYDYAGIVYDFFKNRFGRDSIDGHGMALLQTVRYCDPTQPCPFANAFWNGQQMVYGQDYASADDVVGHEMAHGVTDKTSHLFYWFQSGAINESLSDVFGELIDLSDGVGDDSAGVRWEMGEDLPIGAIRDMSDPGAFGNPDRMTSPNYEPGIDSFDLTVVDSGGVHTNSGVNNKAAFLMTDGGTFNGQTVSGIGINKVAQIYYETDANILTSGSDYEDLFFALQQACQNLVGTAGITSGNCTQVKKAVLAVEMNKQPTVNGAGNFPDVTEAPICPLGQVPNDLFFDNMENPVSGLWAPSGGGTGTNKWESTRDYATSGQFGLYTEDQTARTDTAMEMVSGVAVPATGTTFLRFSQAPDFEYSYDSFGDVFTAADGGVVEYNTGAGWQDAGALFDSNGYYGKIYNTGDNPLGGRNAFTDVTGGYFSSRMNLTPLAGQTVRLRFRVGTDTGNIDGFWFGWLIDDLRVYQCGAGPRPGPTVTNKLRNPGFEFDDDDDASPDGWSRNAGALRTRGTKHGGQNALRFNAVDGDTPFGVGQVVTGLAAGNTYRVTGFVNIPATSRPVNFSVKVQWRKSGGGVISTSIVKSFTSATAGWVSAAKSLTSPANTVGARVVLTQGGTRDPVLGPNAVVLADDFGFKQI